MADVTDERMVEILEKIKTAVSYVCAKAEPDWDPPHMIFGVKDDFGFYMGPPELTFSGREELMYAARCLGNIRKSGPIAIGIVFAGYTLDAVTRMRVGESVMIMAETKDGRQFTASGTLERRETGAPSLFWSKVMYGKDIQIKGTMTGFYGHEDRKPG